MTITPDSVDVRRIVVQTFLELDADEDALTDLEETLMIDDGRYIARNYSSGNLFAMWLVEVGIVQFYDTEGNMLRTVNLFDELRSLRRAA
jgi:hypothetical protein